MERLARAVNNELVHGFIDVIAGLEKLAAGNEVQCCKSMGILVVAKMALHITVIEVPISVLSHSQY